MQMDNSRNSLIKRVAVYDRCDLVDSKKMDRLLSMQNNNFEYMYAGIYLDKPGSEDATDCPEFQRLLNDCREGKIDHIITDSLSSFSEHMGRYIDIMKQLKDIGVSVFFGKENIDTSEDYSMLIFYLLEVIEYEKNRTERKESAKNRRKYSSWDYTQIYGYREGICKNPVIYAPEARIVQRIYSEYEKGSSIEKITESLNKTKERYLNEESWSQEIIDRILTDWVYTGSIKGGPALRVKDTGSQQKDEKIYITDHPMIISVDQFEKVQLLHKERQKDSNERE